MNIVNVLLQAIHSLQFWFRILQNYRNIRQMFAVFFSFDVTLSWCLTSFAVSELSIARLHLFRDVDIGCGKFYGFRHHNPQHFVNKIVFWLARHCNGSISISIPIFQFYYYNFIFISLCFYFLFSFLYGFIHSFISFLFRFSYEIPL